MKKAFLYIPQKFYGFITPESDDHIEALFVSGINTCIGITLNTTGDNDRPYVFLCHADGFTDLEDEEHGIPGWIKHIPVVYSQLNIEYDNDSKVLGLAEKLNRIANKERLTGREVTIKRVPTKYVDLAILRSGKIVRFPGMIEDELKDRTIIAYGQDVEIDVKKDFEIIYHLYELVYGISEPTPPIKACDKDEIICISNRLHSIIGSRLW